MKGSSSLGAFFGILLLLGVGAACSREGEERAEKQREHADMRAPSEAAIRAIVTEWSNAANAKDLDRTTSFYADDASLLAPGAPIATGKDAIRKAWSGMMALPGFSLSFAPTKVEVDKAGEMAYEIGTYELTVNDKKGKPATQKGKYVVAWKKQADGTWKAAADIFNADQ